MRNNLYQLGIVNAHFVSFRAERSGVEKSCSFDAAQDRFNRSPAFGRDDNGASFNHNWYYYAGAEASIRAQAEPQHRSKKVK